MGILLLTHSVCLIFAFAFTQSRGEEWNEPNSEPKCYSRFDYDHKVLMKLVALETEQTRLNDVIKHQDDAIKQQDDVIKHQDDVIKQQNSDIKSMKSSIGATNSVTKLTSLSEKLEQLAASVSVDGSGSTYVRWGRTDCPSNGTELVYDGYAGGSHYTHSGGAANYLCLPKDPIWDKFQAGYQNGGLVYGAEYELHGQEALFGKTVSEYDVPCAVCRTKRSSTMMLPARNQCYPGWTLEYSGYLSGGYYKHARATEFVCLDHAPSVVSPGGSADQNGVLFYTAQSACGSLRCPPYVDGRELTCAVCSK